MLNKPTVLPDPVVEPASDADGTGASIYGSVIREAGVSWRRRRYNLVESCGMTENHLVDLPFHSHRRR